MWFGSDLLVEREDAKKGAKETTIERANRLKAAAEGKLTFLKMEKKRKVWEVKDNGGQSDAVSVQANNGVGNGQRERERERERKVFVCSDHSDRRFRRNFIAMESRERVNYGRQPTTTQKGKPRAVITGRTRS
jgi:hypothetical protein